MMDITAITLLGVVLGLVAGIMPGIGPLVVVLSMYPFLLHLGLLELIVFYIALVATTQFYGSVVAIATGSLGEITSGPAAQFGHPLFKSGKGAEAILNTASGSFIGALVGIAMFWLVGQVGPGILAIFNINVLVVVYILLCVGLVTIARNKLHGVILLLAGMFVGNVGFNPIFSAHFLTHTGHLFESGVPFYPLFLGFVAMPMLFSYARGSNVHDITVDYSLLSLTSRTAKLFSTDQIGPTLRGCVIGALTSFIPGLGYSASSNFASIVEQKLSKAKTETKKSMDIIVSAETANNIGAVVVLIPLLVFGLPIIASESVILGLAESKGFGSVIAWDFLEQHLYTFISVLFAVSVLNWVLAGFCYKILISFFLFTRKYVYYVFIILLLSIGVYQAIEVYQQIQYAITFLIALFLGGMFRKVDYQDRFILIIGFFISGLVINDIYRFIIINL